MSGVRVLTVHHEDSARRAVLAVVDATPGFESVGDAASAEEALELAVALRPSLALVGLNMPGIDGLETSARLTAALPDTTVVVVTATDTDALTPGSLQAVWEGRQTG
jgi:DNA-binding NarL/FixJ family response regulator